MSTFTLAELRAEVDRKYAPVIIENGDDKFIFQPLLQLPSDKRHRVMDIVKRLEALEESEFETQLETLRELLLATEQNGRGGVLLDLVGDSPALITELATRWMEGTQPGEAAA